MPVVSIRGPLMHHGVVMSSGSSDLRPQAFDFLKHFLFPTGPTLVQIQSFVFRFRLIVWLQIQIFLFQIQMQIQIPIVLTSAWCLWHACRQWLRFHKFAHGCNTQTHHIARSGAISFLARVSGDAARFL